MTSWIKSLGVYADRRMAVLAFLGFSSGLPLLLVYSTLTFWLIEEGLDIESVGLFAATALPYSLKFLWAPVLDRLSVPVLGAIFGLRRGWLLLTQIGLMGAIALLAMSEPGVQPMLCAAAALLVAFLSASQDVVVDAYRIERLDDEEQGAGAAAAVFGYRMGMLVASAGALHIAQWSGDWQLTYVAMSALMLVGVVTTLSCAEPARDVEDEPDRGKLAHLKEGVIGPLKNFAARPGWLVVACFVVLYKLGDALANTMVNPLLADLEFSNTVIANIAQTWGLAASIIGIFIGGLIVRQIGIVGALWVGGVLQMVTNLMLTLQASVGQDAQLLTVTIGVQNLSGGLGTAAFVAYLSALCHEKFTATQYAILTALAAALQTATSTGAGFAVSQLGWAHYFIATAVAAVPGLVLLYWLSSRDITGLDLSGNDGDKGSPNDRA